MNNKKGFVNIILIILVVILAGTVGYLASNQKNSIPGPISSPIPTSEKNKSIPVSLGQQFTLGKNQIAKVDDTGLEVKITEFYNSPCKHVCVWSGVGMNFEYRFNDKIKSGINMTQAFGYRTTIVKTDNETYANLIIEKMK